MSTQPPVPKSEPIVSDRRTVLRSAAMIGLAGAAVPLLAACGDEGDSAGTGANSPATSAPQSSAPADPTSAPSTAASPANGGPVLAKTSEVPVGGGMINKDAQVVVTQPTAGQFKGYSAVCTHQQCVLANVAGGTINCGCHGSKFAVDTGEPVSGPNGGPASMIQALAAVELTVDGDQILGPA